MLEQNYLIMQVLIICKNISKQVGKTILFVNHAYSINVPSVLMDSWEFGSVLKIQADIPQATENESWDLVDGETYNQDIFINHL